jgi:hypothetical protein
LLWSEQFETSTVLQNWAKERKSLDVIPVKMCYERYGIEWFWSSLCVVHTEIAQASSEIEKKWALTFSFNSDT